MKKVLSLILALVMCLSLCACGGGSSKKSLSDRAADAVSSQIKVYVKLSYEVNGVPQVTTYVTETSTNHFKVTGKVTVRDAYGDTYSGKYDATAVYDPATDSFDVDYDIAKLYKN